MRIAFVSLMYDAPWGGSEVLWSQTAARALQEGHQVMISTYSWPQSVPQLQKLVAAGAHLHQRKRYEPNMRYRALDWLRRLPQGGRLSEITALERFAPEVVVVSQGGWHDLLYHEQLRQWLQAVPHIIICHNYHDPVRLSNQVRQQMRELFAQAQQVLMISELQQRVIERQLANPLPNARVIQNPLALPAHYPVAYPTLGAEDDVQLGVIGSFDTDRKGQDVLLELLAQPAWSQRRWHLNLYGKGPDEAYLRQLITYYGLAGRVTLHGHVTDSQAIWEHIHLLVVPSRIESGPMVVQEAALCGRPVVAADVGLVRTWVDDDQTGFIALTSSMPALQEALDRAWSRQPEWERMGAAAAEKARRQLLPDAAGNLLQRLLQAAARTL